ncbi:MAG: SDR family NAD(P)-dependent oxidoreductase [Alphaproteobacteria bacterium]|nr:SDR family NAD(P)-dependent oxidoreductase [Alphaproteobacteria bacterium]
MKKANFKNEVIWIIGASSGIGKALAFELANAGANVVISARRMDELEQLKTELAGSPLVFPLDVTDSDMMTRTAQAIRAAVGHIDRVIFMSAAYTPMQLGALDLTITRNMIEVNILGAFHVIHAVLPILKEQTHGQIALCGSVAGYIGLPDGQPYSATKAAVANLAESLHAECPLHINVKLISPGFVRTPLTEKNEFKMPMIITPERAAQEIAAGLQSNAFEIHFPKRFTLFLKLLRWLPYWVSLHITRIL